MTINEDEEEKKRQPNITFRVDDISDKDVVRDFAKRIAPRANLSDVMNSFVTAIKERPEEALAFLTDENSSSLAISLDVRQRQSLDSIARSTNYVDAPHFISALVQVTLGKSLDEITEYVGGVDFSDLDSQRISNTGEQQAA